MLTDTEHGQLLQIIHTAYSLGLHVELHNEVKLGFHDEGGLVFISRSRIYCIFFTLYSGLTLLYRLWLVSRASTGILVGLLSPVSYIKFTNEPCMPFSRFFFVTSSPLF